MLRLLAHVHGWISTTISKLLLFSVLAAIVHLLRGYSGFTTVHTMAVGTAWAKGQ